MAAGKGARDTRRIAQRSSDLDKMVNDYISKNPSSTVINLACGFDTRFWRIENEKCNYIEIDLPEVIALKKEILKDYLSYELIGCSVLDTTWIDKVTANGNGRFLLIAEGLIMYLPEADVRKLLQAIAQRFTHSQLLLELIPEKYTKGLMHKVMGLAFRLLMGMNISFIFGVAEPRQIESYGQGLKVIDVKGRMPYVVTASIGAS
jgi:O-methyltransferase involved in polyketide biosynthesis